MKSNEQKYNDLKNISLDLYRNKTNFQELVSNSESFVKEFKFKAEEDRSFLNIERLSFMHLNESQQERFEINVHLLSYVLNS